MAERIPVSFKEQADELLLYHYVYSMSDKSAFIKQAIKFYKDFLEGNLDLRKYPVPYIVNSEVQKPIIEESNVNNNTLEAELEDFAGISDILNNR
ncbi:hypothetical protein D3C81_09620 [compost metagenome]